MSLLLNPRVLIALALAGLLAFSHFTVYRKGKANVRMEWAAATAEANSEARKLEQQRQRRADDAQALRTAREARIVSDAATARVAVGGLRDALNTANRSRDESASAAAQRAITTGQLLIESVEAHRELAATCDRHVNDLRMLLEAWPR